MLELPSFKYKDRLRGIIVIITTLERSEYYSKWFKSQKVCFPAFPQDQDRILTRLWIPIKSFDRYQTIISDSLTNHNKFYNLNMCFEKVKLKINPVYTDGNLMIDGVAYKILDGKIYKRIRKHK